MADQSKSLAEQAGEPPFEPIGPHVRALMTAIPQAKVTESDAPAVQLAYHYARIADAALQLGAGGALIMIKLGPPYLASLTALGLTPAARRQLLRGPGDIAANTRASPHDELRKRRQARKSGGG